MTQHNRVRLEAQRFLLIRQPIFSRYEAAILDDPRQFFGLVGPQGFGKSAFLYCFAVKYSAAPEYLVVFLPEFPPDATSFLHKSLARAFYRGCRIAQLTGYATLDDDLGTMIQKFSDFAAENGKKLILVIDQMNANASHFSSTLMVLRGVNRVKVVLSSSTSNQVSTVFGSTYETLKRYSFRLSLAEATLLQGGGATQLNPAEIAGLPFQVAAEKIRGVLVPLSELA